MKLKRLSRRISLQDLTLEANGRKKKANTKNIDMANHMFEEVAPKYADRNGGYTRMIKIGARRGDGAEVVIIELV